MTSVAVLFYFMVDQNSGLLNKILVNMGWMDPENKFSWLTDARATELIALLCSGCGWIHNDCIYSWYKRYTGFIYERLMLMGQINGMHLRVSLPLLKPILYNLVTWSLG